MIVQGTCNAPLQMHLVVEEQEPRIEFTSLVKPYSFMVTHRECKIVLVSFSIYVIKIPDKNNLKEEKLF